MNSLNFDETLRIVFLISAMFAVFLATFLSFRTRGESSFQKIKNLVGTDKTCLSDLHLAIDEINKVGKGRYTLIDAVNIKLNNCDFKLAKCNFSSVGFAGYNDAGTATSNYSKAIYVFSLDKTSSEIANKMHGLLKLWDKSENIAIFSVKDFNKLEKKIELELHEVNNDISS